MQRDDEDDVPEVGVLDFIQSFGLNEDKKQELNSQS
jgi:hypothetical protein